MDSKQWRSGSVRVCVCVRARVCVLVCVNVCVREGVGRDGTVLAIFCVTQVNPALGTLVAIVGTRASCHPIPVLMMVAPAASMALASITISSHVLPAD